MRVIERTSLLVFSLASVIVIGISAYAIIDVSNYADQYQSTEDGWNYLLTLASLQTNMLSEESAQRAYALTGKAEFLGEYHVYRRNLEDIIPAMTAGQEDKPEAHRISRLRELVRKRLERMNSLIADSSKSSASARDISTADIGGKEQMEKIQTLVRNVEHSRLQQLHATFQRIQMKTNRLILIFGISASLYLLLLIVAFYFLRHRLRHRAELIEKLEVSAREVTLSNQFNGSLQSCGTREEASQVIKHYMQLIFPSTTGALYVMRASRNILELSAVWGKSGNAGETLDMIQTGDCWSLRLGRTHQVRNATKDMDCAHVTRQPHGCYFCIPMMAQGEIIGMLHFQFPEGKYPAYTIELAESIAAQMATALSNLTLREALRLQNIRDPLTNLFNRRYLEETMEREVLLAQRNRTVIGMIMVDVDHFKNFNDNHGHQAGDELLRVFASYLRQHIRGGDIVCRYGGEEFVIVLPGSNLEKTLERAEELRLGMHNLRVNLRGQELPPVTGSFGVSVYPIHAETWEQSLHVADIALYRAKQLGRDRVESAEVKSYEEATE